MVLWMSQAFLMLNKPDAGEGARDENLGVSKTLSKKGKGRLQRV